MINHKGATRKCQYCGIVCGINGLKNHEYFCEEHKRKDTPDELERWVKQCMKRRPNRYKGGEE
jgi:hypothetical protein